MNTKASVRLENVCPLALWEDRDFISLKELSLLTGRSRASMYRDTNKCNVKKRLLVKGRISIVPVEELWKLHGCSWFHRYANSVNSLNRGYDMDSTGNLEDDFNEYVSILVLKRNGFNSEILKELAVTGFIPCIKVPGAYMCRKSLIKKIIKQIVEVD